MYVNHNGIKLKKQDAFPSIQKLDRTLVNNTWIKNKAEGKLENILKQVKMKV